MSENTKQKNQAPKELEGTYVFTVKGSSVTIKTNTDEIIKVRCHPEDKFDISEAIKVALYKSKIKIGDVVKITDPSKSYTTKYQLFNPMQTEHFYYAARFRYGVLPSLNAVGQVIDILKENIYVIEVKGEHLLNNDGYKKLVCNNTIYLMGKRGIERV